MQPPGHKGTRAWTHAELEDDALRSFCIRNRKELLTVLMVANATNKSELTEKLLADWEKSKPNAS